MAQGLNYYWLKLEVIPLVRILKQWGMARWKYNGHGIASQMMLDALG